MDIDKYGEQMFTTSLRSDKDKIEIKNILLSPKRLITKLPVTWESISGVKEIK